jgi:hypothetical protein
VRCWVVRLFGVLVAAVVAVVTAVALSVTGVGPVSVFGSGSIDYIQFSVVSVIAAFLAALLLSTRVRDGRLHGVGAVIATAALTYVVGVLLFPIVAAAAAWPEVSNGGAVPCLEIRIIGTESRCAGGLQGAEALQALFGATLGYYPATPVALVMFAPLLVILLVPSLVWTLLMRLTDGDAYQRSV